MNGQPAFVFATVVQGSSVPFLIHLAMSVFLANLMARRLPDTSLAKVAGLVCVTMFGVHLIWRLLLPSILASRHFHVPTGVDWLSFYAHPWHFYLMDMLIWLITFLLAFGTVTILRRPTWTDPMLCRECGYNLTGNVSGTCPECGAVRKM